MRDPMSLLGSAKQDNAPVSAPKSGRQFPAGTDMKWFIPPSVMKLLGEVNARWPNLHAENNNAQWIDPVLPAVDPLEPEPAPGGTGNEATGGLVSRDELYRALTELAERLRDGQ